jgi:hypothetical protein
VLAWAHNPLDSLWFAGPSADNMPPVPSWSEGLQQANRRILDPEVMHPPPPPPPPPLSLSIAFIS